MDVQTASFAIGKSPEILKTSGIGSCIVICLYSHELQIGALAHLMLPTQPTSDSNKLRYIDSALPYILSELKKINPLIHVEATIIGGANMFPDLWSGKESVGNSNILMAKKILQELNIPISRAVTGGTHGRSLEFHLVDGTVNLTGV